MKAEHWRKTHERYEHAAISIQKAQPRKAEAESGRWTRQVMRGWEARKWLPELREEAQATAPLSPVNGSALV